MIVSLTILSLLSSCETLNIGGGLGDYRGWTIKNVEIEPVRGSRIVGGEDIRITVFYEDTIPPLHFSFYFSDGVSPLSQYFEGGNSLGPPYWLSSSSSFVVKLDPLEDIDNMNVDLTISMVNGGGNGPSAFGTSFEVFAK